MNTVSKKIAIFLYQPIAPSLLFQMRYFRLLNSKKGQSDRSKGKGFLTFWPSDSEKFVSLSPDLTYVVQFE